MNRVRRALTPDLLMVKCHYCTHNWFGGVASCIFNALYARPAARCPAATGCNQNCTSQGWRPRSGAEAGRGVLTGMGPCAGAQVVGLLGWGAGGAALPLLLLLLLGLLLPLGMLLLPLLLRLRLSGQLQLLHCLRAGGTPTSEDQIALASNLETLRLSVAMDDRMEELPSVSDNGP